MSTLIATTRLGSHKNLSNGYTKVSLTFFFNWLSFLEMFPKDLVDLEMTHPPKNMMLSFQYQKKQPKKNHPD